MRTAPAFGIDLGQISTVFTTFTNFTNRCYNACMKRATITMSEEVEAALQAYLRDQQVPLALTAVAELALREYLSERGYLDTGKRLHLPVAAKGSGAHDVGIEHDRYLAEE
jgi:hypothetical protein